MLSAYGKFKFASFVVAAISFSVISGDYLNDQEDVPSFFRVLAVLLGTITVFILFAMSFISVAHVVTGFEFLRTAVFFDWRLALPILFTYEFVWEFLKLSYEWVNEL